MKLRPLTLLSLLAIAYAAPTKADHGDGESNNVSGRPIPSPVYGVTIDSVDNLSAIVDSLGSLSRTPTTRIVFDEIPAKRYVEAVSEIHDVSYVMGELLDSYYMKNYSVREYLDRTYDYLDTLGSDVDVWEIGNEINGNWLGDTDVVLKKMTGAFDIIEEHDGRTALTLYHDQSSDDMLWWARTYVPERMKEGLDYVLVSFYEDDQKGIQPDWPSVFRRLARIFPNSQIGFGEVGTRYWSFKRKYLSRYYQMKVAAPNYIGGYFWWYFKQDMVPRDKPMWRVFNRLLASSS